MPAEERTLTSGAPRHKGGGCENGSRSAGRSGSGPFDPGVGGTKNCHGLSRYPCAVQFALTLSQKINHDLIIMRYQRGG